MHKVIVQLKILLSFTFTWKIAFHVASVTSGFVCAWLFLSALSDKRRSLEWKLLPSASPGTPVIAVTHTNQPVPIPYRPEYFFLSGLILTTARVVFITIKIAFIFTSLSAVHIYDIHIFTVIYSKEYCLCIENNSGTEYDSDLRSNEHYFNRLLTCGIWTHDLGDTGAIFFRPSFHYCFSSIHYCEDRYHIHVFIRSSNMTFIYAQPQ